MELPDKVMGAVRRKRRGYLSADLAFQFWRDFIKIIVIPFSFLGFLSLEFLDKIKGFEFLYCLADIRRTDL